MATPTKKDVEQLVSRWVRKMAAGNPQASLSDANSNMQAVDKWFQELQAHAQAMLDLWDQGEFKRKGRTGEVRLGPLKYNGRVVGGVAVGKSGKYKTRIKVMGGRGHHCTCPDWEKNHSTVGPCKHVLKMSQVWLYNHVTPAIEASNDRLVGLLEHAELG